MARSPFLLALAALATLAAAPAKPVTVVLWEEEQPAVQAVLDEAFGRCAEAHPELRVKRSHFNTEDLRVQFQTGAMAGAGADVVLAPSDFAGVFAIMGIIDPVESWAPLDQLAPLAIRSITDHAKHAWGVPINVGNHLMLFVDRKQLAQAPTTMEELVAAGKPRTDPARHRFGLAYNATEPFWLVPFVALYGGHVLAGDRPALGTPAMTSALTLVRALETSDRITPEDCDYNCAETLFLERKAAMTINGDWALQPFAKALGHDLIVAPLPRSAKTGQWMEPMASGKFLMLRHGLAREKEAAARELALCLTSEPLQRFLAEASKRLPSSKAVLASPVVQQDPLLKASLAALAHAQPLPMAVQLRAVWDAIRPQLQAVMSGRQTPQAAAARMQQDAAAKIADMAH